MSRNYSKGVYTLEEIAQIVLEKCPGRFKHLNSAYASVKSTMTELGIEDINGKKRYKLIAARDAERIIDAIRGKSRGRVRKEKRAAQVSLFDRDVNWTGWLDEYTPDIEKTEPEQAEVSGLPDIPAGLTREEVDAIAAFMLAWQKLSDAFNKREGGR